MCAQYTICTAQCKLHSVRLPLQTTNYKFCSLHTANWTLHTLHSTLCKLKIAHTAHYTLQIEHCTHCTLHTANWTFHTLHTRHCKLNITHTTHCKLNTAHTAHCKLNTAPWKPPAHQPIAIALHNAHCTLHTKDNTLLAAHCTSYYAQQYTVSMEPDHARYCCSLIWKRKKKLNLTNSWYQTNVKIWVMK